MILRGPRFDTPCRVAVEQSEAHFHAHVELDGDRFELVAAGRMAKQALTIRVE